VAKSVPTTPTEPNQIAAFQEISRPRIKSATLAAPPRSENHIAARARTRPSRRFWKEKAPSKRTALKEVQPSVA